ncbi:MAG: PHP domain-containing protein [Caldilineaceae bacterium]
MQFHDYHMHTNFSCDCKATMADMCRSAIAQEIPEIGFTEHYDLHPLEVCRDWFQPEPWWAELGRCRAEFAGRLIIRSGIEVGEPHLYQEEMQAIVTRYPFDYILGSLHWVGRHNMFDINYFKAHAPGSGFASTFFVELEKMTRAGGFDILSHFDVFIRTAHAVCGHYHARDCDLIRPILRNCIEREIALDLNTSALQRANVLTPNLDILRWYVELEEGNELRWARMPTNIDIGSHLDVAVAMAKEAGLRYLTYFSARQAELRPMP